MIDFLGAKIKNLIKDEIFKQMIVLSNRKYCLFEFCQHMPTNHYLVGIFHKSGVASIRERLLLEASFMGANTLFS